ncbi:MAG: hypothetical protein ACQESR_27815, partial [Planctomycetota bacterium]
MTDKVPKQGSIVRGTLFPEPVQVIACVPLGESIKLVGKGLESGQVYEPILDAAQLATLDVSAEQPPFDGNPTHFRLGIEALRLG